MKKGFLMAAIVVALVLVLGSWVGSCSDSRLSLPPELQAEVDVLRSLSDSLEQFDWKIREHIQELPENSSTKSVEDLKRQKQALWVEYKDLRTAVYAKVEEVEGWESKVQGRQSVYEQGRDAQAHSDGFSWWDGLGIVLALGVLVGIPWYFYRRLQSRSSRSRVPNATEPVHFYEGSEANNGEDKAFFTEDRGYFKDTASEEPDSESISVPTSTEERALEKDVSLPVQDLEKTSSTPEERRVQEQISDLQSTIQSLANSPQQKVEDEEEGLHVDSESGSGMTEKRAWSRYEEEDLDKAQVIKMARRGSTVSEISRRMKKSQSDVELILKNYRENT
jgi:hypothetical protein